MNKTLKVYDLAASPNSVKVRLALGLKKIPYEKIAVDPQDREQIVKLSGQPLTPILLHGDTVIYDSYAILRYLDANWPNNPPRLFSTDRTTMKKIEEWEMFNHTQAGTPVGMVFGEAFAKKPNAENLKKANQLARDVAGKLEDLLSKTGYLVGDEPTAADLTIVPMVAYGMMAPEAAGKGPIAKFFYENLKVEGFPKTSTWVKRVMAYDA